MSLGPEFQGQITLDRVPDDFVERLQHRVETGLLVPGNRRRANYKVLSSGRDEITFGAEGFATAYAIGLNRVTVRRAGASQLDYQVSYWDWTKYATSHGILLGFLFWVVFELAPGMRQQVSAQAFGPALFWGLVAFFSLAWPWLLTALHQNAARQALEQILRETMDAPGGAGRAIA